ncbi:MAG: F0F1 ATP synthase subunit A [Bacillota bacterium]|jgi:F-type H+-transporting ATPase subunit a|nr:F0F1 ATP synthase subunit A [Bacillota bacterium]
MHESHGSDILFHIFGLPVSSYVTTMWAIMAVLFVICVLVTRRLNKVPGQLQNLVEFTVEGLLNFFSGILGTEKARRYFPLLASLFLFILFSNWSGILPGAGHVKGFRPPTSTVSVTAGLAIVVFFSVQIAGIREKGLKYFKHFIEPIPIFLPITLIEEFVKPLSLSLRLYGNIFGEETVVAVLFSLVPYFSPIPMQMLGLLFGFIQALVFTTLAAIYIANATAEAH